MPRLSTILLSMLIALQMCSDASAEVRVRRVKVSGWPDGYCISNGSIELTLVPAAGRILGLNLIGKENVLWQGYTPVTAPPRKDKWINAGGDRALPWPQSDWPDRIGRIWPPPLSAEINTHQLEVLADKTIRMTSPVITEYGVRLIRMIRMHATRPQVEIETIMERVAPGPSLAMSPWLITQCQADASARVIAERTDTNESLQTTTMLDRPWPQKSQISRDSIEFLLPGTIEAKIGLNAEILLFETKGTMLTQRATSGQADKNNPERAQIFSPIMTQDGRPTGNNYVELEFIGQPKMLGMGESTSITVLWELSITRR